MEDSVESLLAAESTRGPRMWRGKPLAPMSRGLRDLAHNKVIEPDDSADFHDVALLHILAEAYHTDEAGRVQRRRALIQATDDKAGFRTKVSLIMDELGEDKETWKQARELVNEILGLVETATVSLTEKKSEPAVAPSAEPNPTTSPSTSPTLSGSPDGVPSSSSGS